MSAKRRRSKKPFSWFSAVVFNMLLLVLAYLTASLIVENKRAIGEEFVTSSEAVTATREEIAGMFADLVPANADPRSFWAGEIHKQLSENDLVSARGLLMAAPSMLNKKDASAMLAAADTETEGRLDDRLLSAAKLFLPDDVRAKYERATSPNGFEKIDISDTASIEDNTGNAKLESAFPVSAPAKDNADETDTTNTDLNSSLFVLGNERDLAYQSAGWLRGDRTDTFALSISGLGLAAQQNKFKTIKFTDTMLHGASLIKSARRADRLQPDFRQLLQDRLERAIPPARLKAALEKRFGEGGSIFIQSDAILAAFAEATDESRLGPFLSDLERMSRLSENRSQTSALTLIETVSSLRDLKRAELLAFAGGDRSVALAKYYGPDALDAAQTVLNWTMNLIVLIMSVVGLMAFLIWLAFSTLFKSFGRGDSFSQHYGYT